MLPLLLTVAFTLAARAQEGPGDALAQEDEEEGEETEGEDEDDGDEDEDDSDEDDSDEDDSDEDDSDEDDSDEDDSDEDEEASTARPSRPARSGGGISLEGPWKTDPFLRPAGGLSLFSTGGTTYTAVSVGARAGLRYRQTVKPPPALYGQTRAIATVLVGSSNYNGLEARLGTFAGPLWKWFGIQLGPDLFWNRTNLAGTQLPDVLGCATPLTAFATAKALTVYGGLQPAWYATGNRLRMHWSQSNAFGFGHEFSWLAGVALDGGPVRLSVDYSRRITRYGTDQGVGVGLRVGG